VYELQLLPFHFKNELTTNLSKEIDVTDVREPAAAVIRRKCCRYLLRRP